MAAKDTGLYQEVVKRAPSSNVPLYEAVADATGTEEQVEELSSLKQLIGGPKPKIGGGGIKGKKEVDLNNPPDSSASEEERNAYYDALAAQARAERNGNIKTDEMVPQHASLVKPNADQRAALMQQAMGAPKGGKKAAGDGPSAEQKAALMQQAMGQATISKKKAAGSGPTAEQRAALMSQAQATSGPPKKAGPTAEQRAEMAKQAMAGASNTSRRAGPTAEQRAALMQQAMGKNATAKPRRAAGPTAEQRAEMARQAMASAGPSGNKSRPGAPSAEDRARLMASAMQRK